MHFRRVDAKKRGLIVAEQVIEAIRVGLLQAGDQLPPERELAEQTAVSRPSVREALTALHLAGLVETRPGEGTFVTRAAHDLTLVSAVLSEVRQSEEISEALEARRAFEKAAAQLVVERSSTQARADLGRALSELREAAQRRDFEAYDRANTEFHAALARGTGNAIVESTLLALVNRTLGDFARKLRSRKFDSDPTFFDNNYMIHESIFHAIAASDSPKLTEAIDRHYDAIEQLGATEETRSPAE